MLITSDNSLFISGFHFVSVSFISVDKSTSVINYLSLLSKRHIYMCLTLTLFASVHFLKCCRRDKSTSVYFDSVCVCM